MTSVLREAGALNVAERGEDSSKEPSAADETENEQIRERKWSGKRGAQKHAQTETDPNQ
jgi:hypothetical protein